MQSGWSEGEASGLSSHKSSETGHKERVCLLGVIVGAILIQWATKSVVKPCGGWPMNHEDNNHQNCL